jgi:hypothetical protein
MRPNLSVEKIAGALAVLGAGVMMYACGGDKPANTPVNSTETPAAAGDPATKAADGHCGAGKEHKPGEASCGGKAGDNSAASPAASASAASSAAPSTDSSSASAASSATPAASSSAAPADPKKGGGKKGGGKKGGSSGCGAGTCSAKK